MAPIIDKVLCLRCTSCGYQYSEIAGSLSSVKYQMCLAVWYCEYHAVKSTVSRCEIHGITL